MRKPDPKNRERTAAYRKRVGPVVLKDQRLRHLYGISLDEYNAIVEEQDGYCPICQGPLALLQPHIDHDHESSVIRGVLCSRCNQALGLLLESPQAAERLAAYLRLHGKLK